MPSTRPSIRLAVPLLALALFAVPAAAQFGGAPAKPPAPKPAETARPAPVPGYIEADEGFKQITREGGVDLDAVFNMADLTIPRDEIHTLIAAEQIPAMVDPITEPVGASGWLQAADRVVDVTINDASVAVPIKMLARHEAMNMTVGGEPVAVTYSPLSDSVTVFSRRIEIEPDKNGRRRFETLDFGVSGALYNSNVLYYDRKHAGLWSQLAMSAVSGSSSGQRLRHYPVRVIPWEFYRATHPSGQVLVADESFGIDYTQEAYAGYVDRPELYVPVRTYGDVLPAKTRGLGVCDPAGAIFIPITALAETASGSVIETSLGPVRARRVGDGVAVLEAPPLVQTATSLYFAWSAFYPEGRVLSESDLAPLDP